VARGSVFQPRWPPVVPPSVTVCLFVVEGRRWSCTFKKTVEKKGFVLGLFRGLHLGLYSNFEGGVLFSQQSFRRVPHVLAHCEGEPHRQRGENGGRQKLFLCAGKPAGGGRYLKTTDGGGGTTSVRFKNRLENFSHSVVRLYGKKG